MDRTRLYHKSCPDGMIFEDEDEFKEAKKKGWVEAPWLVDGPPAPSKSDDKKGK